MERVVVYSVTSDAESAPVVAQRFRSNGVNILEQQDHMLLVSGDIQTIRRVLENTSGWNVSELATVPRPRTRERVLKKPQ
jgi:hypothetical protein